MPFLRNVTRGRGIPDERLAEVAEHYQHFGGVSPINDQNRALIAALRAEFAAHGIDLPIYWGNRNWQPYVADTVRQMRDDGVRRALVFATSATDVVLGLPAVPRGPRPRRRRRSATARRSWSSCGTSSTTPASSRPTPTACGPRWRRCRTRRARLVFTAHSIPVVDERRRPGRSATGSTPRSSARRPGWSPRRCAGRAPSSTWSGSRGPGRRRCRGSSRTSTTTCARWPRAACRRSSWRRPASCPTTSRCSGTSTRRPRETAAELGLAFARAGDGRHPPGLRRGDPRAGRGAAGRRRAARARHARAVRHRLPGRLLRQRRRA